MSAGCHKARERSSSVMLGHFSNKWRVKLSGLPFGNCFLLTKAYDGEQESVLTTWPHLLQLCSYLLLWSANLAPRSKNSRINAFGLRPMSAAATRAVTPPGRGRFVLWKLLSTSYRDDALPQRRSTKAVSIQVQSKTQEDGNRSASY